MEAKHFLDPCILAHLPASPGVYWMLWSWTPHGAGPVQPKPIERLIGTDSAGVLYIGCAANLRSRAGEGLVKLLLRCSRDSRWGDYENRLPLFDYFHSHAATAIPRENLALAWEVMPSKVEAQRHEQMLYYNYRRRFGERPPFQRDFSMSCWITLQGEAVQRGPLLMPSERYQPAGVIPAG